MNHGKIPDDVMGRAGMGSWVGIHFVSMTYCFFSFNVSRLLACVCYSCLIQYNGMALRCLLPFAALRYSISVSNFCDHGACVFSRMKNQHGHGMWMSTGRKNGLMWRRHTLMVAGREGYM